MKKLIVFLMVVGSLVAATGPTQATPLSWLTEPVLGYNSSYNGNVIINSGLEETNIPHSFLPGDPLFGTGSPSMTVFYVGQQVHTGSGVYVDAGVAYNYFAIFTDLTDFSRSVPYSGSFTGPADGFWMTWNTPAPGGDAGGLPTLKIEDVGKWLYSETYKTPGGVTLLTKTTEFEVLVPEPTTMLLLGLGLIGLAGVRRIMKRR